MVLKMNLRGIFLVKCLMVLFFCVKGSAEEVHRVYGVLGASALLNIPDLKEEKPYEIKWLKDTKHIMKKTNSSDTFYGKEKEKERFKVFLNGTLQINQLVKADEGNYAVEVYNKQGRQHVKKELNLILQAIVYKPEIKWKCSKKTSTVTCEVTQKDQPTFQFRQNNKSFRNKEPKHTNGTWKVEYETLSLTAKLYCEVSNNVSSKAETKEMKCSGLDIVLILSIAGGAVVFVIFLALLIYYIRKKIAERFQEQVADEEILMQMQQADNELKHRALPPPPGHGPQKQPRQQRRPPPQSQTHHQEVPPRPKPRTQQKSPNHIKERP